MQWLLTPPADTPAPAPRAPGWGRGSGLCSGHLVLGAQAGVQRGSPRPAPPPPTQATGCSRRLSQRSAHRDPPLAATPPPKRPLSPAAQQSRKPPLSNSRDTRGTSPHSPRRVPPAAARHAPLTGHARSGLAFPASLAVGPLPSSDALLLLLLFRTRLSLRPLLQKTLTNAGGERSQPGRPGNGGLPPSDPFSWLLNEKKFRQNGEIRNREENAAFPLGSVPSREQTARLGPAGTRSLPGALGAGWSCQLDARKQTRRGKGTI